MSKYTTQRPAGYFTGRGNTTPLIGDDGKPMVRKWLLWSVPLFEFTSVSTDPLTFHCGPLEYQPDRHVFPTDGGSIPPILWCVPGLNPWQFPRAYPFHDCAFRYGGMYVNNVGAGFVFEQMDRKQCNALLAEMLPADGASWWAAAKINLGVWLGSRWCWDESAQAENRRQSGIVV